MLLRTFERLDSLPKNQLSSANPAASDLQDVAPI